MDSGQVWWCIPLFPSTWEAKAGQSESQYNWGDTEKPS